MKTVRPSAKNSGAYCTAGQAPDVHRVRRSTVVGPGGCGYGAVARAFVQRHVRRIAGHHIERLEFDGEHDPRYTRTSSPAAAAFARAQATAGEVVSRAASDSSNAVGNFCFEVSLSYRRVERPWRGSGQS